MLSMSLKGLLRVGCCVAFRTSLQHQALMCFVRSCS